ncbi:MAG: alpha/beta hydrolase [Malacoplasma sp.]|nr:alpha/beta hydrolase [Malacoplasma sp.]
MNDRLQKKWERFSKFFSIDKKNKNNIVYFHAFTGSYKNKSNIIDKFLNCNFYAFDMPGHGQTPVVSENEISIHNFSELAIEFILDYDIKNIILFGHSMGGGICNIIANDSRISSRVEKIILESPANPTSKKNYETIIKYLIPDTLEQMGMIGKELFYNPIAFFGSEKNYLRFISIEFQRLQKQKFLKKIIDKENQDELNIGALQAINNNKKPTLLILGKEDNIIPYEESVFIFKQNPVFEIFTIENTKHVPIAEKTNIALTKINDFIK